MMTSLERQMKEQQEVHRGIGFTIRKVGIGDGVQFTSLPENFYKATGQNLIDVSKPWYLDYNPYVLRDQEPKRTVELWNYPKIYEWSPPRPTVYMTNAEIHCSVMGIKDPQLIHPRLYKYEEFPFEKREMILFHPFGKSHGALPPHVIEHVIQKYKGTGLLYQIGLESDPQIGIPRLKSENLWELAWWISKARMLIGVDSGPAWIASCYPDVIVKKIRTKWQFGFCEPKDWIRLDIRNEHSFWDDSGLFKIYNCTETPLGFTESYREL